MADAIDRLASWARDSDSDVAADLREVLPGLQRARVWKVRAEPAERNADLGKRLVRLRIENERLREEMRELRAERDALSGMLRRLARRMVHVRGMWRASVDRRGQLRVELERYRATVTTGGPGVPITEAWEPGPSTRPPTAPPEEIVVALPVSDEERAVMLSGGGVPLDWDPVYGDVMGEEVDE